MKTQLSINALDRLEESISSLKGLDHILWAMGIGANEIVFNEQAFSLIGDILEKIKANLEKIMEERDNNKFIA